VAAQEKLVADFEFHYSIITTTTSNDGNNFSFSN